jgi:hypothetical protein
MAASIDFLKSIGVQWKMLHWQEFDKDTKIHQLYQPYLDSMIHAPFEVNDQPYKLSKQSMIHATDLYQRLAGPDWPIIDDIVNGEFRNMSLATAIRQECEEFLIDMEQDKRITSKNFNEIDLHPSPLKHLSWVQKHFETAPVTVDTINWLKDIDQHLLDNQSYKFQRSNPVRF